MQPSRRSRTVVVAAAALVLALFAGWMIWLSAKNANVVGLRVAVFPSDASLTIDGQAAQPGKLSLHKGKHTLKVTRHYFGDTSKMIDTATINPKRTIYVAANPNTPEASAYLAQHPEEVSLLERAQGTDFTNTQESLAQRYPFLSKLPYRTTHYKIDYTVGENKDITLQIALYSDVSPDNAAGYKAKLAQYRTEALDYLHSRGANTDKLIITFSPDPDKDLSSSLNRYDGE